MNEKFRFYGMIVCLIILIFSWLLLTFCPNLGTTALFLTMFVAGYALRETLEERRDEE
jgi:cell division protein FtsW (lipid II flippase)